MVSNLRPTHYANYTTLTTIFHKILDNNRRHHFLYTSCTCHTQSTSSVRRPILEQTGTKINCSVRMNPRSMVQAT